MDKSINHYLELLQGNKKDVSQLSGFYVYALWKDDEIVYIGQTVQLEARLVVHTRDKDFDEYSYFKCRDGMEMDCLESYLINELRPKYNKALGHGYISINKVRERIRKLDEKYKHDTKYYVHNLKKKMLEAGIDLVRYKGVWSISIRDLSRAIEYILEN